MACRWNKGRQLGKPLKINATLRFPTEGKRMDGQESKTLKNWHSLKREPATAAEQITERSLCHGCNNETATLQKPGAV